MKRTISLLAAALLSTSASADWVSEINYFTLGQDDSSIDVSVGGIGASLGYQFQVNDSFYITPELRVGMGVSDDTARVFGTNVEVELDNYYGAGLRGEFYATESFYVVGSVSYIDAELSASAYGNRVSDSDGEFGFGIGAGFIASDSASIEAGFEKYDEADMLRLGLRISF